MGFFVNLGSLLSRKGTTYHGSVRSKPLQELLDTTTNEENYLGNWARQLSGSALTDAEREANAFNAQQAQLAFDRQMAARSTAFQTQVQDMKAAGLNPMMAASGSGSAVPSAGGASSVSPGSSPLNLGSLLSSIAGLKQLSIQDKLADAEIENKRSQTKLNEANADKIGTETDYLNRVFDLRSEAESLSNDMTRSQMRLIEQSISESKAREKSALAQAVLSNANADNIAYLKPYVAAELSAKTDLEKKQSLVAVIEAAYRQKLIDSGVIEMSIKETGANIKVSEAIAELNRIQALIQKGDKHALSSELGLLDKIDFWAKDVLSVITKVVDSVPINFVVK